MFKTNVMKKVFFIIFLVIYFLYTVPFILIAIWVSFWESDIKYTEDVTDKIIHTFDSFSPYKRDKS